MIGVELVRATRHTGRGLFNLLAEIGAARMSPPRDALAAVHRLAGAVGTVARAHELSVSVRGHVPRSTVLLVANHVSYIDPLAILPVCPAAPLAKAEVESWPLVGTIGAALGVVWVRRNDHGARARVLRRVHDLLESGVSVLNFPEGTTRRDRVDPFFRGTFGIAQRVGVPVVPVAIRYRDPTLAWCDGETFLPHYLGVAARPRVDVTVTFCPPLPPRAGELAEDYAARARHSIIRALAETKAPHATIRDQLSPPRADAVLPFERFA